MPSGIVIYSFKDHQYHHQNNPYCRVFDHRVDPESLFSLLRGGPSWSCLLHCFVKVAMIMITMILMIIWWWLMKIDHDYDDNLYQSFYVFFFSISLECLSTRQYIFLWDPGQAGVRSLGPNVSLSLCHLVETLLTWLWLMKMLTQYKLITDDVESNPRHCGNWDHRLAKFATDVVERFFNRVVPLAFICSHKFAQPISKNVKLLR